MMAANSRRGEISAKIDGREHILCLTLGALAELESAFSVDDLSALAERFSTGRLSARDLMRIIGAGLRGGGTVVSDDEVAALRFDGGAAGCASLAGALLALTFGSAEQGTEAPSRPRTP
ncbi:gene transfer agent family protein [Mesorhizobium sp. CAU 1741]|uniref:gene transfer agent family protein n=1 Tax=Mesorhizobium sp. CAU 1741 TaxID=3140366 RepID=UPI00325BB400